MRGKHLEQPNSQASAIQALAIQALYNEFWERQTSITGPLPGPLISNTATNLTREEREEVGPSQPCARS